MSPKLIKFLQQWAIYTIAVFVAASIVPGIHSDKFPALLAAAFILGFLNAFVRPLLLLLSLPLLILTLGMFYFVINGLLLWFVGSLIKGFHVETFWAAFWGALIISFISLILNALAGSGNARVIIRRGGPRRNHSDDDGPVIDV